MSMTAPWGVYQLGHFITQCLMYVILYQFELLLPIHVNWLSNLPGSKGLLHCSCIFVDLLLEEAPILHS